MSQFSVRPVGWVDLMLWSASLGDAWRQADRAQRMGKGRSRAASRRRAIRQAAWNALQVRGTREEFMKQQFLPDWVSPPGETIEELLGSYGFSLEDLGVDRPDDLISGKTRIDAKIAERLAERLGGTGQFWLNRDQQYIEDCKRLGLPLGGSA